MSEADINRINKTKSKLRSKRWRNKLVHIAEPHLNLYGA